jgi:hypothetical protein
MNAITNTDPICEAFAPAEASAIPSETTKAAKRLAGAINFVSGGILQTFAWVLTTLYLAGATALGGAILYYTFVR